MSPPWPCVVAPASQTDTFLQDSRSNSGFSFCARNIPVSTSALAVLASATSPWQNYSSLTGELSAVSLTSHR